MTTMTPNPVFWHGRITSGSAEGTNGVIVDIRKEDPYNFLHNLNLYIDKQYHKQHEENFKWAFEGKFICPYKTNLFLQQQKLAGSNNSYSINTIGYQNFRVVDTLSSALTPTMSVLIQTAQTALHITFGPSTEYLPATWCWALAFIGQHFSLNHYTSSSDITSTSPSLKRTLSHYRKGRFFYPWSPGWAATPGYVHNTLWHC